MEKKQEYKLFAGKLKNLPDGERFSYYGWQSTYALVFSPKDEIKGFVEVNDAMIHELKKDEKDWLLKCKLTVNSEYIAKNSKEYSEMLSEYADILEKELKEVAEKSKKVKDESTNNNA